MTHDHRDHISAGMDGALSSEELRFLLRRLDHDAALRDTWSRYHLVGDSLRRQLAPLASEAFIGRVMAAIDTPVVASVAAARKPSWLRWSAGTAIAASVAVAALMLARPAGTDASGGTPVLTADGRIAPTDTAIAAVDRTTPALTTPASVPPWLSASNASQYSQQAAATLGESYGDMRLPYARQLAAYPVPSTHDRVRADGDRFLLVDPRTHARRAAHAQ